MLKQTASFIAFLITVFEIIGWSCLLIGGSAAIVGYVLFDIVHDTYDQLRRKR